METFGVVGQAEKKDAGQQKLELKYPALRLCFSDLPWGNYSLSVSLAFSLSVRKKKDDFYKIIFRELVIITQGSLKT